MPEKDETHYYISLNILKNMIPSYDMDRVLSGERCDIDLGFLGFTQHYLNLSMLIPEHFTIIDLGCAYNSQCYFFQNHKEYVAVDLGSMERFKTDNCTIYEKDIKDFIREDITRFNMDTTFAICNYVPLKEETRLLVHKTFNNLYSYYPAPSDEDIQRMKEFGDKLKKG